jgi:sugar phosphate isomerase/epimerase
MDIYASLSPFGEQRMLEGALLARELGCTAVEVPAGFLRSPGAAALLATARVAVVSVSWRADDRPDLKAALELAAQVGAWAVNVYASSTVGQDPVDARQQLVVDVCGALSCAGAGDPCILLENALEGTPGIAASGESWMAVLDSVGSARFRGTFDPANFFASGDPGAVQRILECSPSPIAYVHAKSVLPYDAALHGREPYRRAWHACGSWLAAPVDEGLPDWTAILQSLRVAGYAGAYAVEPFAHAGLIRRSVEHLRRMAAALAAD